MNNSLRIILIFIFLSSCSLHKDSKFWSKRSIIKEKKENVVEILKKNKNINKKETLNLIQI